MSEIADVVQQARTVTITGEQAVVRWGYYSAATVRSWTVSRDEHGQWTMHGTVAESETDTFKLSQRPLVFVVTRQGGFWRWPIDSLQVVAGTLSASLGPQEKPHVAPRPSS